MNQYHSSRREASKNVQKLDKYKDRVEPYYDTRWLENPEVNVIDRIIEIPKPVIQEQEVEIPCIEWVEKIVEVPVHIYKQKQIEVKRPFGMESIPQSNSYCFYNQPKMEYTDYNGPNTYNTVYEHKNMVENYPVDLQSSLMNNEYQYPSIDTNNQYQGYKPLIDNHMIPYDNFYPNYANNDQYQQPVYRYIPKYVHVQVPEYRPVPVKKIVTNEIQIPVELQIEHEITQPSIKSRYVQVPTHISNSYMN